MTIVGLILILVILGLVCWLLVRYIPMVEPIRSIVVIVFVLVALLLVLQAFGLMGALDTPVPHIR